MATSNPNSWEGVKRLAKEAGCKHVALVAAQWALESGWGKHAPGENYFGLKGAANEGEEHKTQEFVNGEYITITANFLTFSGLKECVQYLVDRWYKDWDGFQGVDRCADRNEAARELVAQGYATDPAYAEKLIELMDTQEKPKAPASKPVSCASQPQLVLIRAREATVLKKQPKQASALEADQKVEVAKGREYSVEYMRELAGDAHVWVELAHEAGDWFIWQPHWQVVESTGEAMPQVIDWGDFNCLVTPHLTVGEVLQYDKRRKPVPASANVTRILKTAAEFEKIRLAWGSALGVSSFYRPEPYNTEVGGVANSRHITGEAMDIYPVGGRSLESFYQWIRARWTGGLGDGRAKGFVHLDTRNNGHFVPGAGVRPYTEWTY